MRKLLCLDGSGRDGMGNGGEGVGDAYRALGRAMMKEADEDKRTYQGEFGITCARKLKAKDE